MQAPHQQRPVLSLAFLHRGLSSASGIICSTAGNTLRTNTSFSVKNKRKTGKKVARKYFLPQGSGTQQESFLRGFLKNALTRTKAITALWITAPLRTTPGWGSRWRTLDTSRFIPAPDSKFIALFHISVNSSKELAGCSKRFTTFSHL